MIQKNVVTKDDLASVLLNGSGKVALIIGQDDLKLLMNTVRAHMSRTKIDHEPLGEMMEDLVELYRLAYGVGSE